MMRTTPILRRTTYVPKTAATVKLTAKADSLELMSYRSLVKTALSLGLPGNLKREEYLELLRLHRMGFVVECRRLALIMKTKRQTVKKSNPKNLVKKRSVGRPRKPKIEFEPPSDSSIECYTLSSLATKNIPVKKESRQSTKPDPLISKVEVCSSNSYHKTVHQPPIAKTTSQLLRSMLLSTDRTKFNKSRSATNNSFTTSVNDPYNNYYQYGSSRPLNLEISHKESSFMENSSKTKWKSIKKSNTSNEIKSSMSGNSFIPDLQAFPDIPQLADVDINASFEQDNSNYSINDTDTDSTVLHIDDSDTLSNQSAENTEQRDFDQRWAMSLRMENGEMISPLDNCETFYPLDDNSLLGPQDTALVQNDVIQNYIETNDVQFMQLPESSIEVIRTLQYYETRILPNAWSMPEHLQNCNESVLNENAGPGEQANVTGANHTLAEFTNMLPCPISGCLWYSHSATLYVHLFTCHQGMIYYGNSITHIFRCQDIQTFCFYTHLQYVQNTIYIITVAFDCYSRTFVATIQHVSSYGDNTSVSPTTATLATRSLYSNNDEHSWTGQVQPYSVPLDVLHADGRCLFIDPTNSEHVIIVVNLTVPLIYSNDSMLACL